jgi:positive regulator of sigma E activity
MVRLLLYCQNKNLLQADIMYLGPALLFAVFASLFYVPGFLDMPLAVLTARQFISQLLFSIFGLIALAALARSIELDPVWPWRPEFRKLITSLLNRT